MNRRGVDSDTRLAVQATAEQEGTASLPGVREWIPATSERAQASHAQPPRFASMLLGVLCCLAWLALAGSSRAVDLPLSMTLPSWNATRCDSIGPDGTPSPPDTTKPLLDLLRVRVYGQRFSKDPAPVLLDSLDARGLQGQSVSLVMDIAPGSMGNLWFVPVDYNGNEACWKWSSTYVFAVPAVANEPGLRGDYYDNKDFTAFKLTRIDPQINFDWDYAAPDTSMGVDQFTIRWTGFITPALTGTYAFHMRLEDGCYLYVGPAFVISDWSIQNEHEGTGYANLIAGTRYSFKLEYLANNGTACAILSWTPPGGVKALIPAEAFSH